MDGQGEVMIRLYMQDGLRGFSELVRCIEKQKLLFKQLIKEKTGKNIRKTPKRGNQEWKFKLFAIDDAFKNDIEGDRLGQFLNARLSTSTKPFTGQLNCEHRADLSKEVNISTPKASRYRAANKPLSSIQQKQNIVSDGETEVLSSRKDYVLRSKTKCKKNDDNMHAAVLSRLAEKPSKKSEIIRKLEAKQKAVISNKEEMIKIKAEKARRDREERALRVLQNNKKKEQEKKAAIRAMRQKELALEELRQYEATPTKFHPRTLSRANSNSPARLRLFRENMRNIPCKLVTKTEKVGGAVNGDSQPYGRKIDKNNDTRKRKGTADVSPLTSKHPTVTPGTGLDEKNGGGIIPACSQSVVAHDAKMADDSDTGGTYVTVCHEVSPDNAFSSVDKHGDIGFKGLTNVDRISPQETIEAAEDVIKKGANVAVVVAAAAAAETAKIHFDENKLHQGGDVNKKVTLEHEREEVREKLGFLDSSQLNNKNLMNVTACSSYELTPPKACLPSTEENYNIDDLSSEDETDEEDHPKKTIPTWAQPINLRRKLREQAIKSLCALDSFFGKIETPDLNRIFSVSRSRYAKRTSSALWNSPLTNPREGVSMYYALQKQT